MPAKESPSSVHYSELTSGGAFRATSRIVEALAGISSASLVLPASTKSQVRRRLEANAAHQVERLNYRIVREPGSSTTFTLWSPIPSNWESHTAGDVANLHWVVGEKLLDHVLRLDRPVIWTLHDCWPLTGGCHHPRNCQGWRQGCSNCPQSRRLFRGQVISAKSRRGADIRRADVHAVAPSTWMESRATDCGLFQSVTRIPNPLPRQLYDRPELFLGHRRSEEVSARHPLVLAAIAHDWRDPNKGLDGILRLAERINESMPVSLRLIGGPFVSGDRLGPLVDVVGSINTTYALVKQLNGVDAVVSGSGEENLPTILIEAQALGIPCIARNSGGSSDIVVQGQTGWLVESLDEIEPHHFGLVRGKSATKVSERARIRALEVFSPDNVATKYLDVYHLALGRAL